MCIYRRYDDEELEKMWDELEDMLFTKEENGTLVLNSEWNGFNVGTPRETIWEWFDRQHSKGISWLINRPSQVKITGRKSFDTKSEAIIFKKMLGDKYKATYKIEYPDMTLYIVEYKE